MPLRLIGVAVDGIGAAWVNGNSSGRRIQQPCRLLSEAPHLVPAPGHHPLRVAVPDQAVLRAAPCPVQAAGDPSAAEAALYMDLCLLSGASDATQVSERYTIGYFSRYRDI